MWACLSGTQEAPPDLPMKEAVSSITTRPVHQMFSLGNERKSLITHHLRGLSLLSFLRKTGPAGIGAAFNSPTLGSKHTIRLVISPSFLCVYPPPSLGVLPLMLRLQPSCPPSHRHPRRKRWPWQHNKNRSDTQQPKIFDFFSLEEIHGELFVCCLPKWQVETLWVLYHKFIWTHDKLSNESNLKFIKKTFHHIFSSPSRVFHWIGIVIYSFWHLSNNDVIDFGQDPKLSYFWCHLSKLENRWYQFLKSLSNWHQR